MKKLLTIVGLLPLIVPTFAWAETLDVAATEQAVISNPDSKNEVRLLVRFSLPAGEERRRIDTAYFDWPMTLATTDEELPWTQVVVYEAQKQWDSRSVSWSGLWTKAGGDADVQGPEAAACLLIPGKANVARFEVTVAIQAWEDGTKENFGFVVVVRGEQTPMIPAKASIAGAPYIGPVLHIVYADDLGSTSVALPH